MEVQGSCDSKFQAVRQEFERNFRERGEVGASVCVTVGGETVVDLWGGIARTDTQALWMKDTIGIVFSSTKGATALCAHILASRGQLDLDAPVAKYWPEFAQAGKARIPVFMLLNHQAGLPAVRTPLPQGAYANWDLMVNALAKEEPFWEPGTRNGYHALTIGWLVGELVRRISGKSLGTFFQDEVAKPLGLDFWIGLPEDKEPRVAPMIDAKPDPESLFFREIANPGSLQSLVLLNSGGYMGAAPEYDTRAAHAAEIGAAGGITNGRGLAGMYAPLACGGKGRGVELVNPDVLARMGRVASATGRDAVLVIPSRFSLGFMKTMDNRRQPPGVQDSVLISEDAFGHVGAGGSFGFADPKAGMSFGYTMNRMGPGAALNDRGQSLVDATYRALGYRSSASGAWT
ncbi:MAG: beta-lactamase family protein [Deltaproteobacteria bacterium]|nr:beta-lactamase family protein [Deltaproteobacteria bacterium]